ncbi:MAG: hypothetical protein N3A58_07240 [Spirochaetes bacterium]|nr:hypothetical protein [Spirochaetota bacterium]
MKKFNKLFVLFSLILAISSLIFLLFYSCTKKSSLNEESILGDWEAIKGYYQQISFQKEGEERLFYSYLDGKPFSDGTWSIKGSDIIIKLSTGEEEIFKNVTVVNQILSFNKGEQQYQRVKTATQKMDELIKEIMSSLGFTFSNPSDIEFNWNSDENDVMTIKGKSIKTSIELSTNDYTDINNAVKKVAEFLKSKGFNPSNNNATEQSEAYESDVIKIRIKIDAPANYNPETDESIDIKGQKATLEVIIGIIQ